MESYDRVQKKIAHVVRISYWLYTLYSVIILIFIPGKKKFETSSQFLRENMHQVFIDFFLSGLSFQLLEMQLCNFTFGLSCL